MFWFHFEVEGMCRTMSAGGSRGNSVSELSVAFCPSVTARAGDLNLELPFDASQQKICSLSLCRVG